MKIFSQILICNDAKLCEIMDMGCLTGFGDRVTLIHDNSNIEVCGYTWHLEHTLKKIARSISNRGIV